MNAGVVRVEIGVDCADPARLAAFWAAVLDRDVVQVGGAPEVHDPTGREPRIWFQPVPEAKVVKNRLHLDLWFADEQRATERRDRLTALGARATRRYRNFWLMAGPDGNEFCLCWGTTPTDDAVDAAERPA